MKRDRIEGNTRQSEGQPAGWRNEPAGGDVEPVGRREHLLDALRECYGIANGEAEHRVREFEAGNDRAFESDASPVAALLRGSIR